METTCKITDVSIDYKTLKPKISLLLDTDNKECIDTLKNVDKLNLTLKKWYKKRSLDANSYCWVLCDKIAKELSKENITTKEQVYKDTILSIGSYEAMIIEERAFDNFKRIWERQGLGFLIQEVARKDKCVKVNCYYGSSTYDSKEMSYLINLLVETAKNYNIETKSEAELKSMLKEWE